MDNDAAGTPTYSRGGKVRLHTLWLDPTTIALVVIRRCAPGGVRLPGKSLRSVRRVSGRSRFRLGSPFLTNLGNSVSEFAGIAASLEIFDISKYVSVPISAVIIWFLIVKGSLKVIEKVFLVACMVYVAYPIAAYMASPPWMEILTATVTPVFRSDSDYLMMMIGVVGTTIAPWMQFYQQSAVVEKRITIEQYTFTRIDVIFGCIMAIVVATFIVVSCAATIHQQGLKVETAADAAMALKPLVGKHATVLFAFGLFNASLFAACILPISTSFYICEGLGWESGVDKDFRQAPQFFWLFYRHHRNQRPDILIPTAPPHRHHVHFPCCDLPGPPLVSSSLLKTSITTNRPHGKNSHGPSSSISSPGVTFFTIIFLTMLLTFACCSPHIAG